MKKGNFGIRLAFYGVLAFVLAYLGSTTLLFLLAAVAIYVEKDEWASRQVMQAIIVCFAASVLRNVLYDIDIIGDIPFIGSVWSVLTSIIYSVIDLLVLVLCVVGIIKNLKDQDADIPVAKNIADWAYGVVKVKAAPAQAAPAQEAPAQEAPEQPQQ